MTNPVALRPGSLLSRSARKGTEVTSGLPLSYVYIETASSAGIATASILVENDVNPHALLFNIF